MNVTDGTLAQQVDFWSRLLAQVNFQNSFIYAIQRSTLVKKSLFADFLILALVTAPLIIIEVVRKICSRQFWRIWKPFEAVRTLFVGHIRISKFILSPNVCYGNNGQSY